MAEFDLLRDLLSTGGNVAMIAVALLLWRLDRRVLRLEIHLGLEGK